MTAELAQLQLHMPGLLKLLGEHLYADPRVAWRELVQNAHDSCVRLRASGEAPEGWQPRIEVRTRRERGRSWVVIRDTGAGLSADEIRTFLATIGRGQTAELREALEARGDPAAKDLVGQFGVGLLAAFLVGDRVVVETRRHDAPPGEGLRWTCDGQQTYRLEPIERQRAGTDVRVRIRADAPEHGEPEVVRRSLRRWARWLEIPILLDDEPAPINARRLPWAEGTQPAVDLAELAAELSAGLPPLAWTELSPYEDPELGRVPLRGLAVIPARAEISTLEHGTVAALVRRMVITEREEELLPRWARFVTGLVDCPILAPTASRESLRRDRAFERVGREIERQILAFLGSLREERPEVWARVIEAHESMLKRWASHAPALFEAIADRVTFGTTRGRLTLPEYLGLSGDVLYYFSHEQQARTMALLLESAGRPVIDAQWAGDVPFLRAYAEARGKRIVEELGAGADGLIARAADASPELRALARRLEEPGLAVELSRFEPAALPVLLVVPRRLEVQRLIGEALEKRRVPDALSGLIGAYTRARPEAGLTRTLHLNAASPLIRALARMPADDPRLVPAASILRELARIMTGERLSPGELQAALLRATGALGELLGAQPGAAAAETPLTPRWGEERAGLSPDRARRLAERVATIEALAAMDPAVLARELGLALPVARAIRELAEEDRAGEGGGGGR